MSDKVIAIILQLVTAADSGSAEQLKAATKLLAEELGMTVIDNSLGRYIC